jgi:hypothetical protein
MPGRRPLVAFVALFTLPLSACLHVSASLGPTPREEAPKLIIKSNDAPQSQQKQTDFKTLPNVPGTVVHVNKAQSNPGPQAKNPDPTPKPSPSPTVVHSGGDSPEPHPLPISFAPTPEPPLLAAVRAYVEGNPQRAIEIIRTLDPQKQDFILAMLPIFVRGANADLTNDAATVGMLVDQLDGIRARLEPRAALRVENVNFCKEVAGFGRYTPRGANEPYRPNTRAQLYLEVKNLGSRPSGNEFITHVHATVEIRDAYGKMVELIDPEDYRRRVPVARFDERLVSHSPLRDFHVRIIFSAPPAPGVYTITAELRDAATGRTVKTQPTQFCVAGP